MKDFSEEIDKAIDLMLKLSETPSKKKNLLGKGKIVYLQIVLFRIPFGAPRTKKYLKLCHSLHGDEPEICLFVPNRQTNVKYKKTTDELIDFCVDYYTEFLEKHKIKGITTVMPLKQLSSEYGTYELRRKLVQRFDLFLCKNSLLYNPRFISSLGKFFRLARKEPLGIPFPKEDVDFDPEFQKNIERAILTTTFNISRFSDNYSIPFGSLSNTKSELKENLQLVLDQIFNEKFIPGGFKNIRAINLWPSQSKPIPIYISTELPVETKMPRVQSKKRKKLEGVEDELSTQPNKKVLVMPSGEVFVTKINKKSSNLKVSDSEDEDSFVDESDEEEVNDEKNQNNKSEKEENQSESEDDEEIERKETMLMKEKILNEDVYTQSKDKKNKNEDSEEEEEEEEKKIPIKAKRKRNISNSRKNSNENFNIKNGGKGKKLRKTKQNKTDLNKLKKKKIKKINK